MEMPLIIDIALAAIILISLAIGAWRGAFRAISGLAGTILGALGAVKLGPLLSPTTAAVITPLVRTVVEKAAENQGVGDILESQLTQDILQVVGQLMETLGLSGDTGAAVQAQAQATGERVVDAITGGLVGQLAPMISFVVLFFVVRGVVSFLLGLLSWEKLPLISSVNKLGGAALGLLSGALIVAVLCWGFLRFAPEEGLGPVTRQHLLASHVGGAVAHILDRAG